MAPARGGPVPTSGAGTGRPDRPRRAMVRVTPHGLHVPAAELYLDARAAPGTVFVSHAHGDHCAVAGRIVCTPETSALHVARRGPPADVAIPLGETRRVGPAELTLRSAGHTVG